jgi:hypothetical protein
MYSHASFKGNPRKGIINIEDAPNAPIFLREMLGLAGQQYVSQEEALSLMAYRYSFVPSVDGAIEGIPLNF